jgi:hypothetical protein
VGERGNAADQTGEQGDTFHGENLKEMRARPEPCMSLSTVFASKLPPTAFGQKQVMWPTQRV